MTLRTTRSSTTESKPKTAAPVDAAAPEKPMPTDAETLEFLKAIDAFKRQTGRNFPSWTEALVLLYDLGWRKAPPSSRR